EDTRMPRCGQPDLAGGDPTAVRLDSHHPVAVLDEARHLAVLDDVDTHRVAGTCERPRDVIVLRYAGARLVGGPQDRVADVVGDVEDGAHLLRLVGREVLRIHAVELVRVRTTTGLADVLEGVREVEDAALREEEVV